MHCLQAVDLIGKKPSKKLDEIHKKVRNCISFMEEDKYFGLVTNDFESPSEEIVSQACKLANQENRI